MKAQASIEFMIAVLAFTATVFVISEASNSINSRFEAKISSLSSYASEQLTTAKCNLVYLKGKISEYEIHASEILSESDCFSDEYYLNQKVPKVGAMKPWF